METPTHVNPLWKVVTKKHKLALDALYILQEDLANKSSTNDTPFVVLADGEFLVTPRYLWKMGRQALQHMKTHHVRDIGKAPLREWLEHILNSEEEIGSDVSDDDIEEETPAAQEEPVA